MNNYIKRDLLLKKLNYNSYASYLRSKLWKNIRNIVLLKYPKCKICNDDSSVVHHIRYTEHNLLGLSLDYLVALCNKCHYYIEFKNNKKTSLDEAELRLNYLLSFRNHKKRKKSKIKKQNKKKKKKKRQKIAKNIDKPIVSRKKSKYKKSSIPLVNNIVVINSEFEFSIRYDYPPA